MENTSNLKAIIESNENHGYGYQIRLVMEGLPEDCIIDAEPLTLDEAYLGAALGVGEINERLGINYEPDEVISVVDDAVEETWDEF